MKILISGATGLVGTALAAALRSDGHTVARLVRTSGAPVAGDIRWDPATGTVDVSAMEGADVVLHLSGASIAEGRWTPERKKILRTSRVDSTRVLVDALSRLKQKPRTFLCASAIGYYGNGGDEILTEASSAGSDFLGKLSSEWEAEASRAESSDIRTVMLRFGVILSAEGGALPRMLTPFKLGVGGRLGSGTQWMSWIAVQDVVGIIRFAMENAQMRGPANVVAPNPVQNAEFTRILAKVLYRPAIFPAPVFMLRLVLGEMADALLLISQRVRPGKTLAAGYRFQFASLEPALRAILGKS